MDNPSYNSLTEKLIQSGILPSNQNETEAPFENNFFEAKSEPKEEQVLKKTARRLKNYDLELLENLNSKEGSKILASGKFEKIIFKIFPKLYRIKIARDAIKMLSELDIDANSLLDKAVPYGESELRYKDLVKYLKYANEVQTKLKKKF